MTDHFDQKMANNNTLKNTNSYSESYSLKGVIDQFQIQKLNDYLKTYELGIKIDQNIYLTDQYMEGMFIDRL